MISKSKHKRERQKRRTRLKRRKKILKARIAELKAAKSKS